MVSPSLGKRAATGDWGLNCVGHPRNLGTRGDVCERWLSRSPIETPSNQPLGGVDRGQMGRPMRTTLGRWGRIPIGTPPAREGTTSGGRQSPFRHPAEGGGPCARVPGKPDRFFLTGKSETVSKKPEGGPAGRRDALGGGGLGGRAVAPPAQFRAARKEKRPRRQGTARQAAPQKPTGLAGRDKRADLAAGRAAPGVPQASPTVCPRPRKTGPRATAKALPLARSASPPAFWLAPARLPSGGNARGGASWHRGGLPSVRGVVTTGDGQRYSTCCRTRSEQTLESRRLRHVRQTRAQRHEQKT